MPHSALPCRSRGGVVGIGLALLTLTGGCASLGKPSWPANGSARAQQRRAVRFDPYLQDDIGPYALRQSIMDGSRPRDFNDPVAEVRRARWWSPMR